MPREIKAAFVQHACSEDRSENLNASIEGIHQAAAQGANLIVLQELHNGLYFCQQENTGYFDWAESIPGPTTTALGEICRQLNVVVVASLFEKRAAGLYHNTAVVFETNGEIAGRYRKMHIPDDPGFYEKFYFTPGDLGFNPVNTSLGRLGVLVCWDQWYPEAARLMALSGAELLIYPTAIGWDPNDHETERDNQREAWIISQRAHAIANGIPVISCNRVGFEADPSGHSQGIQFWGSSFIAGPQGEILAQAPADQDMTQTTSIDLDRSDQVRRIWPFLRDRRIDAYHDILLRYRD
ncbi:MAG: carbon-nitrogen hydrolase [Gammaproteobacteria bacterium]|jgi:N-carbamoylputrescine amidase|nr:carbon-nitrogen hydrolase [Gammaproteobacteria bacterium]